jgi:hypothetical protein
MPTRTPEECRALADRQRAGEDLGFCDRFVREWKSPAPGRATGTSAGTTQDTLPPLPPEAARAAATAPAAPGETEPSVADEA